MYVREFSFLTKIYSHLRQVTFCPLSLGVGNTVHKDRRSRTRSNTEMVLMKDYVMQIFSFSGYIIDPHDLIIYYQIDVTSSNLRERFQ